MKVFLFISTLVLVLYQFTQINAIKLLNNNEFRQHLFHIRSKTSTEIQRDSALGVISRLVPNHTHLFDVEIFENVLNNEDHSFQLIKSHESTKVLIRATDGISACKGFHYYLKYILKSHITWSEQRIQIPETLPTIDMKSVSPSLFIYHQNVCTWGYSFVWWTWHDWRRHIDWMALMGISMSIAPIQEEIWTRVYKDFGLNTEEINDHLTGPAFLPWLRMGNIRGWGGPLTDNYKLKQMELQKKIIKASRDLGMTIAIPGFDGHVPVAMKRVFPNKTLTPVKCWNKFTQQYCCPLFLDPDEKMFETIGVKFTQAVVKEYDTDHLYFIDPFNEVEPRLPEPDYLQKTAFHIYNTLRLVDSNAVWLLQGWMFVDNPFWSRNLIRSFLTAVPQGRIIILDLMSELYPQYERTNSYFGQPFIWCMLHNFGGTLGMHGSIDIVNTRIKLARRNSTMIGVGIAPEGIHQNYAVYEFALERGWSNDNFNITNWFNQYIEARYGVKNDKNLETAWNHILHTVYAYRGLIKLHGKYTITRRPSLKIQPYNWYRFEDFKNAYRLMLITNSSVLQINKMYQHDLVDITRQYLQLVADQLFIKLKNAYGTKDLKTLEETSKQMILCFNDLEKILASNKNFLLGNWLKSAKEMGTTELEEEIFELNARNQITLWGPNGQIIDYASKQWSGIVKDYFLPRWKLFFNELKTSIKKGRNFNERKFKEKVLKEVEHPFTVNRKLYTTIPKGNSIKISKDIWKRWNSLSFDENKKFNLQESILTTPTVLQA